MGSGKGGAGERNSTGGGGRQSKEGQSVGG